MRRVPLPGEYGFRQKSGISRRGLILGAGGLAATAATMGAQRLGHVMMESILPLRVSTPEELRTARSSRERALESAAVFRSEIDAYKVDHQARHRSSSGGERSVMDIIKDRSDRDTIDGKTCAQFFRDAVEDGLRKAGIPQDVALEMATLIPGLIAIESKYDNATPGREVETELPDGTVIKERAQGRIQALPSTFADMGCNVALIHDPHEQAKFLVEYFKRSYNQLSEMHWYKLLQQDYFPGDLAGYRKYCLVVAAFDGYHAGLGVMQDLARWFAGKRKQDAENIRDAADGTEEPASPTYGVMRFMSKLAIETRRNASRRHELVGYARRYGPVSYRYLPELFAHAHLIDEWLDLRQQNGN